MFRFRKIAKPQAQGPVIRDPLAVVPVLPLNIDMKRDNKGHMHLRVAREVTGLRKKIADRFRLDYRKQIELDDYGTLYFSLVDGRRCIRDIVERMAKDMDRKREDIERSVVLFTKQLMTRNLIVLQVTPESLAERNL